MLGTTLVMCAVAASVWTGSFASGVAGTRSSYICTVVVCPLRMSADPAAISLTSGRTIHGRVQVISESPTPVMLTYTAVDACTGAPVPVSVIDVAFDRHAYRAGSGSREFTVRAPDARKSVYSVALTGLRGTVTWSAHLAVTVDGGHC
jgi:hypothetical protein